MVVHCHTVMAPFNRREQGNRVLGLRFISQRSLLIQQHKIRKLFLFSGIIGNITQPTPTQLPEVSYPENVLLESAGNLASATFPHHYIAFHLTCDEVLSTDVQVKTGQVPQISSFVVLLSLWTKGKLQTVLLLCDSQNVTQQLFVSRQCFQLDAGTFTPMGGVVVLAT